MAPKLSIYNNTLKLKFKEERTGVPLLLINGNKVKLPKKIDISYMDQHGNNTAYINIAKENKDMHFSKKGKIIYKEVEFNILNTLINKKNKMD